MFIEIPETRSQLRRSGICRRQMPLLRSWGESRADSINIALLRSGENLCRNECQIICGAL
jgi:hypothetical protein